MAGIKNTAGATSSNVEYINAAGILPGLPGGLHTVLGGRGIDGTLTIASGGQWNPSGGNRNTGGNLGYGATYVSGVLATQGSTSSLGGAVGQYITGAGIGQANAITALVASQSQTLSYSSGVTTINGVNTTNLVVGQALGGTNFAGSPSYAYITAIPTTGSSGTITISQAPTATATGSVTFYFAYVLSGATTASTTVNFYNYDTSAYARYTDCSVLAVSAIDASATSKVLTVTAQRGYLSDFYAGDSVLIINQQGDSTYNANVGNYEINQVASIGSGTLTLLNPLSATLGQTTNATIGNQKVNVYRIPEYSVVSNAGTLQNNSWLGSWGGILAFMAQSVNCTGSGTLTMSGYGYRPVATAGFAGEGSSGIAASASTNASGSGGGGGAVGSTGGTGSQTNGSINTSSTIYGGGGGGGAGGSGGGAGGGGGYGLSGGAGGVGSCGGAGGGGCGSAIGSNGGGSTPTVPGAGGAGAPASGVYNTGGAGANGSNSVSGGSAGSSAGLANLAQLLIGGAGGSAGLGGSGGTGGGGGLITNSGSGSADGGTGGTGGSGGGGYATASAGQGGVAGGGYASSSQQFAYGAAGAAGNAGSSGGTAGYGAGAIIVLAKNITSISATANGTAGSAGGSGGAGKLGTTSTSGSGSGPGGGGAGGGGGGGGGGAGGTIVIIGQNITALGTLTATGGAGGAGGSNGVGASGGSATAGSPSGNGGAGQAGGTGAVGRIKVVYYALAGIQATSPSVPYADGAGTVTVTSPAGYKASL